MTSKHIVLALAVATSLLAIPAGKAITINEEFAASPYAAGWSATGNSTLFNWNPTNATLEVTWDSAQPNSYFHRSIGATLTKAHDFTFSFSFTLESVGYYTNKPNGFQIAIGLINLSQATQGSFLRGTGFNSPNLVEFDYFPPAAYDATVSPTVISAGHQFASSFNFPYELPLHQLLTVSMSYTASNQTLSTTVLADGSPLGGIGDVVFAPGFDDFAVDTIAICSYSDAGQYPDYAGSALVHGSVSEVTLRVPGIFRITGEKTGGAWNASFDGEANQTYTLQCTTDFSTWTDIVTTNLAQAQVVTLSDTNTPAGSSFYRVKAQPAP